MAGAREAVQQQHLGRRGRSGLTLTGRHGEASEWFARTRTVLEEQGARPLRAIANFDEALMFQRRGAPGDRERALALLGHARKQFEEVGMTGWLRRAAQLATTLEARA